MIPEIVELHKKSKQLELAYADQSNFRLDAEYLRVYSPSAEVRGHHPGQAVLQEGKKQVGISSISVVGNYALQIIFDDEHNSGIYSWDYLRELCDNKGAYWQDYIDRLIDQGKNRDPEVEVVSLFDPAKR